MLIDVLNRIEQRLAELDLTASAASREAGLSPDAIRNMQRYVKQGKINAGVNSNTISRLAPVLQTTAAWLMGEAEDPASIARSDSFPPHIIPGSNLVGGRDFPVYAAARGGDEGHQIVTFEPIDYVRRPDFLEKVKDAYGVYIMGDSMEPAFEQGDMALVHPHLPPARGKNVVLYHVPPFTNAEAEAMVKRLVSFDDRDWRLRQYNPARDFEAARADWKFCHRIVGKYEAR